MRTSTAALLALLACLTGLAACDDPEPVAEGKRLSQWVAQLKDGDESAGIKAADVLVLMGETAVPPLVEALRDTRPTVRERAARTLGAMGSLTPEGMAALVRLFVDKEAGLRRLAVLILGRWGGDIFDPGFSTWPVFVNPSEPDRPRESVILKALLETGKAALPALQEALDAEDSGSRRVAAKALRQLGDLAKGAVTSLIPHLKAPTSQERERAVEALEEIGPAAAAAVPALVQVLRTDPHQALRLDAAEALGKIGDAASVPALADALSDATADPELRKVAAEALVRFGPRAAPAIPALVAALEDNGIEEQRRIRHASLTDKTAGYLANPAVAALGAIGAEAVGPLAAALGSENLAVRYRAAWALGEIGPKAEGVAGALTKALKDAEASVRASAAWALGRVESVEAAPGLVAALLDAEWKVRRQAVTALGALVPAGVSSASAALVKALADPDWDVRRAASAALDSLGPQARAAIPALVQALADDALEWTDMFDPEQRLTNSAVEALAQIGPEAIAPLVEALGNASPKVRARAAWALGQLGAAAQAALPALETAAKDPDESVRQRASYAVRLVRGE